MKIGGKETITIFIGADFNYPWLQLQIEIRQIVQKKAGFSKLAVLAAISSERYTSIDHSLLQMIISLAFKEIFSMVNVETVC